MANVTVTKPKVAVAMSLTKTGIRKLLSVSIMSCALFVLIIDMNILKISSKQLVVLVLKGDTVPVSVSGSAL